jgi:hypothetical protein
MAPMTFFSIADSYQILMVLDNIFFNWPITNKNCLWQLILVVRSAQNMEILYRISYTSFQQSNNSLCLLFLGEDFSTNQKQELPIGIYSVQSG